jgi:hypothetical protein
MGATPGAPAPIVVKNGGVRHHDGAQRRADAIDITASFC